jgi:hypothetical protein
MPDCCQIASKYVQGVQGVQGQKFSTLHVCKSRHSWFCALLCRVCRVSLYTRARDTFSNSSLNIFSLAYIYPLHTMHTLHRRWYSWSVAVQGISLTLHTLHNIFFNNKYE